MKKTRLIPALMMTGILAGAIGGSKAAPTKNIIDQVVWVVGDQPIFRSEVEDMYAQMRSDGEAIKGDPYCVIPEQLAVQRLYMHQAKLDTIEAPEAQVKAGVERRIDYFIANLGSKEKVEQYFHKSLPALREQLMDVMRSNYITEQIQHNLTKDLKPTPAEVRKYFQSLPEDSVPYVPMQVETQLIQLNPAIPKQEIEDIKSRLRNYSERVNKGEVDFATLAIMHSEDGSAMQGGELGYHGRADWVPEFSNVAFNLSDPKKVSRIVETEYGYHIIQLIGKRGDQVNVRHILLMPKVSSKDLADATVRLDSLRKEIVAGTWTFDEAARYVSQDKDSRNNKGIMMNQMTGSSRFEMQDLPQEVARQVEKLNPGDICEPFIMKDVKKNRDVAAIVRLTNRIPGHKATLQEDYNLIKEMYQAHMRELAVKEWVEKKIKETYVKIAPGWGECEFQYEGWVK